jgi:cytoskeletal protein CcmA (bactofilin family)
MSSRKWNRQPRRGNQGGREQHTRSDVIVDAWKRTTPEDLMAEDNSPDTESQNVVGSPFRGARERLRSADLSGDRGTSEIGGSTPEADPEPSRLSVIDRHSSFDGKFETGHDLRIEGNVSGEITCRGVLHVAREAVAQVKVQASEVHVHGRLEGDIRCDGKLVLAESAVVSGTIKTATFEMHEGAVLNGTVDMGGGAEGAERDRRGGRRAEITSLPGAGRASGNEETKEAAGRE